MNTLDKITERLIEEADLIDEIINSFDEWGLEVPESVCNDCGSYEIGVGYGNEWCDNCNSKSIANNRGIVANYIAEFMQKKFSTIATKSAEEEHEHNFTILSPETHSNYAIIFCTKCGGKKIPHYLKEQQ